ncbi:hypothetical protein [Kribbella deserti]|uniref:Uncharacterized protein n=1 Tax=Kribbella deserti TaxID=1926257 RepID=A0ABV6QIA8_9ACTN
MTVFEFDGRLIEVTELLPADAAGAIVECWDLTSDSSAGLLFALERTARGLTVRSMQSGVPVALIVTVARLATEQ